MVVKEAWAATHQTGRPARRLGSQDGHRTPNRPAAVGRVIGRKPTCGAGAPPRGRLRLLGRDRGQDVDDEHLGGGPALLVGRVDQQQA